MAMAGITTAMTICVSLLRPPPPPPPESFVAPVLASPPELDPVAVLEVLAGGVGVGGGVEDVEKVVEGDGDVKVDVVDEDGEGEGEVGAEQVDCPPSPLDMI